MSKTIIIIRHAKSSWSNLLIKDHERALDARGHRDAPDMALKLQAAGYKPDVLITSDANRAQTTAAYFSTVFDKDFVLEPSLYHAFPDKYLEQINNLDEDIKTVALFGHNPGVTEIALNISPSIIDDLPTCGIIIASMPDDIKWSNADWMHMSMERILTPKQKNY